MAKAKTKAPSIRIRAEKAKVKFDDLPDLIPHRLVAKKLGITTDTLREWVGKGTFPEPHSFFEQTWLYRVDLIQAFLETGKWPECAKFKRRRAAAELP